MMKIIFNINTRQFLTTSQLMYIINNPQDSYFVIRSMQQKLYNVSVDLQEIWSWVSCLILVLLVYVIDWTRTVLTYEKYTLICSLLPLWLDHLLSNSVTSCGSSYILSNLYFSLSTDGKHQCKGLSSSHKSLGLSNGYIYLYSRF